MTYKKEFFSRYRKYMRIDVALFIASMLGAFTLSGYAYLEKYYLTLDVPVEQINISTQRILAYGAARLGSYFSLIASIIALVVGVNFLAVILSKPNSRQTSSNTSPKWLYTIKERIRSNQAAAIIYAFIGIIAITFSWAWYFLIKWPSDSGREAALQEVSECVERRLKYSNLDEYHGCQVAESNDMIYLVQLQKCEISGVTFKTFGVPKQGLKSITTDAQFYSHDRPKKILCPHKIKRN